MAETYRISKILKFVEKLRILREIEEKTIDVQYPRVEESFKKRGINQQRNNYNIQSLLSGIHEYSYEENGLELTHLEYSILSHVNFHSGSVKAIEGIIRELGNFFDLDIPERNTEQGNLENYVLRSIDTRDYSNMPQEFRLIIGGMNSSYTEEIQEKCATISFNVLKRYCDGNSIKKTVDGYLVRMPTQCIPDISRDLINENIALYGIIPVEQKWNQN